MEKFRTRSLETSEGLYITLASIIQSLAFGFFLTKLSFDMFHFTHSSIVKILQYFATFQLIVVIWHDYVISTIYFQRIIRYYDSFFPFLLGLAQYILITTLKGHPFYHWIFIFTIFCFMSFLAYLDLSIRSKKNKENKEILVLLGNYSRDTLWFAAIVAVVSFVFGVLSIYYNSPTLDTILLVIVNSSILGHVINSDSVYKRIVE